MKAILIIFGFMLISAVVALFAFDIPDNVQSKFGTGAIMLTLVVLLWYAYETRKIAKSSQLQVTQVQKQLEYMEGPNLKLDLKPEKVDEIIQSDSQFASMLFITTTKGFNLEVFIDIVIKVGSRVIKIEDPYLSGKMALKISGEKTYDLQVPLREINLRLIDPNRDSIQIAIFSKFRIDDSDMKFIRNQTLLYCWDVPKNLDDGREWFWNIMPIQVPKDMQEIAFKHKK